MESDRTTSTVRPRDRTSTATVVLGTILGIGFLAAGIAGWLFDVTDGDGSDLVLWVVFLVGGGVIVLAGVGMLRARPWPAAAAFVVGGLMGSLALFWSVLVPIAAIALAVLGVVLARRATG